MDTRYELHMHSTSGPRIAFVITNEIHPTIPHNAFTFNGRKDTANYLKETRKWNEKYLFGGSSLREGPYLIITRAKSGFLGKLSQCQFPLWYFYRVATKVDNINSWLKKYFLWAEGVHELNHQTSEGPVKTTLHLKLGLGWPQTLVYKKCAHI